LSDGLPVEGTLAHPLRLDPFQRIVEVQFGRGIGVLSIDLPEGISPRFEPTASQMQHHAAGDVIARKDFAKFDDETGSGHKAPVSQLVTDKMVLGTLYGEGDKKWAVRKIVRGFGDDPGFHVSPSPFPPDTGLQPNGFPNGTWQAYRDFYNDQKAKFLEKPGHRWIEVADLRSLGPDTLPTGDAQIYFGPGETWAALNYGQIDLSHFALVPYVPPRFNIFGVQQYNTILADRDLRADGSVGYAPYGFNIFEPVRVAAFGVGEEESAGSPGRKAVRLIYFLDFEVIDKGVEAGAANPVAVSNLGGDDPMLPSFEMVFVFQLFGGGTKFTVEALNIASDRAATYNQRKTFPYQQAGELFKVNRQGFVV
jgi:hypothetical protein